MTSFLDLLKVSWDAPYRFTASALVLAGAIGFFLRTTPLLALSGAAGWSGVGIVQPTLLNAHHWLVERSDVVVAAGIAFMSLGVITAYFGGRGASSAMLGVAATMEIGSWIAWLLVGVVAFAWIAVRVYDWVGADSESWRLLSGVNRIVSSLVAAGVYAVTLPFAWAFLRG